MPAVMPASGPALPIRFCLRSRALLRLSAPDRGDAFADRDLELALRTCVVVEVRDRDLWQSFPNCLLDRAEIVLLVRRNESEGISDLAGARCAAYTVDVIVGRLRHIEVDDVS